MVAFPGDGAGSSPGRLLRDALLAAAPSDPQDLHAARLGISRRRLNEMINERRAVTADSALRLARYLGTDAESWLEAQARHDLEAARRDRKLMREIEAIHPLKPAGDRPPGGMMALLRTEGPRPAAAEREGAEAAALRGELELLRAAAARQTRTLQEYALLREFLKAKGLLREAERHVRIRGELRGMIPAPAGEPDAP